MNSLMSREEVIKAQREDKTLEQLHKQALNIKEVVKSPSFYDNELLMRFYRPPKQSVLDTWSEKRQIVVPFSVRQAILEVAHDGPSGQLGIYETYYKILNHFFWPNMKCDVMDFIKSFHVCQIAGKPNQTIPKAPLQPIIVPNEPFEKNIVDCVGPLNKTKKGNEYLLTVMCPTTRFPTAIPVKNITAKNIAKHLLNFFTIYGIPKEIQSDQGSSFTSDLFKRVLQELNIKQVLSSAYPPESQGLLERWHQTFKSMLRKFCIENKLNWDEGIDFLLFAIREAPQESIGFSPFEMLYGRTIRGPLVLIKDGWSEDSSMNVRGCSTIESKRCEIGCMFGRRGMDVLALCETKMKGKGEVAFGEVTGRVSGVERERVREGVALLLSEWMVNKVVEWKEVSLRLMWERVRMGRECWAFVSAYEPGCERSEGERDEFWNELTRRVDGLSTRNYVVVLGDLNARVGDGELEGVVGKYGVSGENESGERLLDMFVEQELAIGNSFFKKKVINKYTWIRVANGRVIERALMGYVLITKRMVGRLKDVHVFRGVAAGMSDNFLVEAKLVVAKEWGNRLVGCRREVVKVEDLKKKKNRKKTGVPGQVERGI